MSWGNKVLIAFVGFAGLIGLLVYSCMQHNFELVSKDYYKDEIAYQQLIDGSSNSNKISKLVIDRTKNSININLPAELKGMDVKGDVWLYCASNSANDKRLPLQVDAQGHMIVPAKILNKGNYQIKINYTANNQQFYHSQKLEIK